MGRGVIGLAVACALVAGCGSDESEGALVGDATLPVAMAAQGPPGTQLRDGFEVAEGSILVGAPIPTDDGWYAVLYVDGDPRSVIDAYVAQGRLQGLEPVDVPSGSPEFLMDWVPVEQQQHTVCGVQAEGEQGYRCSSGAYTGGDGAPCIRLSLAREEGTAAMSSLFISYSADARHCVSAGGWIIGDPDAPVPALAAEPPDLPSAGEAIDGSLGSLVVEDGSEVASPPFAGLHCGRSAILLVTGDPAEVLDRYLDQLAELPSIDTAPPAVTELDDDTILTTAARVVPAGGDGWFFSMAEVPDHPTMLIISGCPG